MNQTIGQLISTASWRAIDPWLDERFQTRILRQVWMADELRVYVVMTLIRAHINEVLQLVEE